MPRASPLSLLQFRMCLPALVRRLAFGSILICHKPRETSPVGWGASVALCPWATLSSLVADPPASFVPAVPFLSAPLVGIKTTAANNNSGADRDNGCVGAEWTERDRRELAER